MPRHRDILAFSAAIAAHAGEDTGAPLECALPEQVREGKGPPGFPLMLEPDAERETIRAWQLVRLELRGVAEVRTLLPVHTFHRFLGEGVERTATLRRAGLDARCCRAGAN